MRPAIIVKKIKSRSLGIAKILFALERPRYERIKNQDAEQCLDCMIAYTDSGGFCVPTSARHRPAAQKVLAGKAYEPQTIAYICSHTKGKDIIHAGTFFGDFLPALSLASHHATVWAFEPNLESFRCAQITCLLNDLKNIRLRNAALGAESGTAAIQVKDGEGRSLGGASRVLDFSRDVAEDHLQAVPKLALDDVIPPDRMVGVLQLDVEGYEREALAGSMKTITRNLPIIILETVPDFQWMEENILALGYKKAGEVERNSVFAVR
jgi:FkbM family methyltransferase